MYNDTNTDWMDNPNLDPHELAMFQQLYPNGPGEDDMPLESEDGQAAAYTPTPVATSSSSIAVPLTPPPPPAARLQIPTSDRAALYQQLRPYPGMSKAEKLSRLLADSFRVGAEPGTGSAIRDASRGFSAGLDSYNNLRDYDRGIRGDYAGRVLSQVGAQEEFARKAADTQADIGKKGADADKSRAYGGYLGDTGKSRLTRADADMIKARAVEKLANKSVAGRPTMNQRGDILNADGTVTRAPEKSDPKLSLADEVNKKLTLLLGPQHDAKSQAEVLRTITGANPKAAPAGSAFALVMDAVNDPDPDSKAAKLRKLDEVAAQQNKMRPPKSGKGGAKGDPLADILQFNMWKFTDPNGVVDWDKMKAAAQADGLERDLNNESQRYVRPMDLVMRIEKVRRGSTAPKGGANSGAFPAGKGGPITPKGAPADELLRQQMGEFARSIKAGSAK